MREDDDKFYHVFRRKFELRHANLGSHSVDSVNSTISKQARVTYLVAKGEADLKGSLIMFDHQPSQRAQVLSIRSCKRGWPLVPWVVDGPPTDTVMIDAGLPFRTAPPGQCCAHP